ncbi:hypothetical protein CsSME_00010694 [Camellia sinensis var. sinensis]
MSKMCNCQKKHEAAELVSSDDEAPDQRTEHGGNLEEDDEDNVDVQRVEVLDKMSEMAIDDRRKEHEGKADMNKKNKDHEESDDMDDIDKEANVSLVEKKDSKL